MKIFITINLLLMLLIGCSNSKVIYYEDFDNYEAMDEIISYWKSDWENLEYTFLDCRIESERKKACIPFFDYAGSKSQAISILKKKDKESPIIIMGTNSKDGKPQEMKVYLEEKGYKNIALYVGGFENYLTKEGFVPNTNCSIDCGC